jgi:hypothetical protein
LILTFTSAHAVRVDTPRWQIEIRFQMGTFWREHSHHLFCKVSDPSPPMLIADG